VHWYEPSYSQEALSRARPTEGGLLQLEPRDELAFLLLYLARDGFVGLRQVTDVAGWWDRFGAGSSGLTDVAKRHTALRHALGAAATVADAATGAPSETLLGFTPRLSPAARAACRLANPWVEGVHTQVDAETSLVDGLLTPAGGLRQFFGRQLLPPVEQLQHRRSLANASPRRLRLARWEHMVRLLRRYALILPMRALRQRKVASTTRADAWPSSSAQ
jgi:hypothetical protein